MKKIQLIFLGPSCAGKTALTKQFQDGIFVSEYLSTIDMDLTLKKINDNCYYSIWDVSGQKIDRNQLQTRLNYSDLFCLVYDATNLNSFNELNGYIETLQKNTRLDFKSIVLIANKLDEKDRQVSIEAHESKLKELASLFPNVFVKGIITSAKEPALFKSMSVFLEEEYPQYFEELSKGNFHLIKSRKLLIDDYFEVAQAYLQHLKNDIYTELMANKNQPNNHPILAQVNCDNSDSIDHLIKSPCDELKVRPEKINSPTATLLGAVYKAQKLWPAIEILKTPGRKSYEERIQDFQISIVEIAKDLTKRRIADSYLKTFLRGLGVFGATLLGLPFLGVGALVGYYYSKQCLFGEKGVTGTKFVDVIKEKSSNAEEAGFARNMFNR